MRARGQLAGSLVVLAVVLSASVYAERELGASTLGPGPPGRAPSGAWFCPHGGGTQWTVTLEVANPGERPVAIRVSDLSQGQPTQSKDLTVPPGSTLAVPADGQDREAASTIEYFGGWVAASWVEHGGAGETGVAAEPCAPEAGGPWLLPEAATLQSDEDFVVVMNPFAVDAVVSLTIYTDKKEPITTEAWTNVVLRPFRSAAFRLNAKALGYATVGVRLDVSVGRVAAATLDLSEQGGSRSGLGYLGAPPRTLILPGGSDRGRSELVVLSSSPERVELSGDLLERDTTGTVAGLSDTSPGGDSAQTFPVTTEGPSAIVVRAEGQGVAAARRTFGVSSDQASTPGAGAAGSAWVVLPAVAGAPNNPGVVLANPGVSTAEVTLRFLPGGGGGVPGPVTVHVPAGRTVAAPKDWLAQAPDAAVLAVASTGTFVPAAASYSLGREGLATYAVALGVPVPEAWVLALGGTSGP